MVCVYCVLFLFLKQKNIFYVQTISSDLTGFNRHVTKFYLRQNRLVEHFRELDGIDNETRADASDTTEHWSIRGMSHRVSI